MTALQNETPEPTVVTPTPIAEPSAQDHTPPATILAATPRAHSSLADPLLVILADAVDDLERTRIANENRLRQLTRTGPDEDGVERGFGLDDDVPQVAQLRSIVTQLGALEHQSTLNLQRQMRAHPLGAWVKATSGVGLKQAARLLSAVGDPYWNTLHDRPRTVSELWAYCGLHVLPAGHIVDDIQVPAARGASLPAGHGASDAVGNDSNRARHAGGNQLRADPIETGTRSVSVGSDQTSDPGLTSGVASDSQTTVAGVAARLRKGQRANWSGTAKMRAYLVAVSCMKTPGSPYRTVYLDRRAHTAGTHPDWTPGHSHNDALRIVAKAVLKDMWRQARDLHGVAS